MHNLDRVAVTNHSLRPIGAADYILIQFDSNALRGEGKYFEQSNQVDLGWGGTRFAIEIYGNHISIVLFELEK